MTGAERSTAAPAGASAAPDAAARPYPGPDPTCFHAVKSVVAT